jgi:hypothetical protein
LGKITDYIYAHRRSLGAQLLEWMSETELLEFSDCALVLAALAKEAGEASVAQKALDCLPFAATLKRVSRKRLSELLLMPPVANLIVDRDAILARRMIIDTRPTSIRCDFDERHPTRCKALVSINMQLYRLRRAERLKRNASM